MKNQASAAIASSIGTILDWSWAGKKRHRYAMGSSAAAICRRWYFHTSGLMVRRVNGLRVT
jgi:hypothetical protein